LAGTAVIVVLAVVAIVIVSRSGGTSPSSHVPVSGPGPATLYQPGDVAVDAAGAVYVTDSGHDRVRRILPDGRVTTVAGHGGDDGAIPAGGGSVATSGGISGVTTLAVDSGGTLYVALGSQGGIAKVSPDGTASEVPIHVPGGASPTLSALAVAPDGQLVGAVGDDVFKLAPDGSAVPVAGSGVSGYTGDGGPATAARLNGPRGLVIDRQGGIYIADTGNNRVRYVRSDGLIFTVAGDGTSGSSGQGTPAVASGVASPRGSMALDENDNLYLASANQVVRVGKADGLLTVVAGRADNASGYSGDGGVATAARLDSADGVARDSAGNLYVSDSSNNRVRKITPDGYIATVG